MSGLKQSYLDATLCYLIHTGEVKNFPRRLGIEFGIAVCYAVPIVSKHEVSDESCKWLELPRKLNLGAAVCYEVLHCV